MKHIPRKYTSMTAPLLGAIMLAALALRLLWLRRESAWWDEYASLVFLDAPSLAQFLQQNRTLDPATLPLYFVLQYYWAQWVSASVCGLRLLSVTLGVATVPLGYALGAQLFNRRAGLVAACCIALSPIHIHHAQGIRMYALLVLLGVASFWSLVRMLQHGRRTGWWLHGAASLLLYWTHPFALLVAGAQGCWLLLHRRVYRPMLAGWFIMHGMLALPVAAYVLSIRFWPQDTTSAWLAAPGLGALLADVFFDDIISFHWQLRLGAVGTQLGAVRMAGDWLFALIILAASAYWLAAAWRGQEPQTRRNITLLFCWLVLPPLALFAVSLVWRPCMFPRYTAHCAIAMYVLLGGATQQFRDREWRWGAASALTALLLFQWVITLPGPQRDDWQSAAKHIHGHITQGDIVLVEDLLWRDVFAYNAARMADVELDAPVAAAATEELVAAQAALYLGSADDATRARAAVWIVFKADYFETAPPKTLELALAAYGLEFDAARFPAICTVYVYRCTAKQGTVLPATLGEVAERGNSPDGGLFAGYLPHESMQAFAELAEAMTARGRTGDALELLRALFDRSPFAQKVYGNLAQAIEKGEPTDTPAAAIRALWAGYGFRENQRFERAREAFAAALEQDPHSGVAALELGMELARLGRHAAAADALAAAAALDGENAELVDNLVGAIRNGGDIHARLEAVNHCRAALIALSEGETARAEKLFQEALARDPHLARAQLMLGFILALREEYDAAFDLFTAYLAHGKYHSPVAYVHLALIHIMRDEYEQALDHATTAMTLDAEFKQRMEPFIRALLIDRNADDVRRERERLENMGVHFPPLFAAYLDAQL